MKFKTQLFLFSLGLTLLSPANAQTGAKGASKPPAPIEIALPSLNLACNQELLQSHGLEGLPEPKIIPFESCGNVRRNCCTRTDEVRLGENWTVNKEGLRIEDEYEATLTVYKSVVNELSKVSQFANQMAGSIPKRLSNCKLLAQRVAQFEVDEVKKQAMKNLYKMKEFLVNAHKGYYCAICNYDNHPFLISKQTTMVLSIDFCRELAKNTISPLLVFEIDILKLLNTVTKYLSSCDGLGVLKADAEFPPELVFLEDRARKRKLAQCLSRANVPGQWLHSCMNICKDFHPTRLSNYLVPLRDKMQVHADYMRRRLSKLATERQVGTKTFGVLTPPTSTLQQSQAKDVKTSPTATPKSAQPAPPQTPTVSKQGRVLNASTTGGQQPAKPATPSLYRLIPGSKTNTADWKIVYRRNGIALHDEGRTARFNTKLISKLKRVLLFERQNITALNMSNWMIRNVTEYLQSPEASLPRGLSSVKVWSAAAALMALLTIILR